MDHSEKQLNFYSFSQPKPAKSKIVCMFSITSKSKRSKINAFYPIFLIIIITSYSFLQFCQNVQKRTEQVLNSRLVNVVFV